MGITCYLLFAITSPSDIALLLLYSTFDFQIPASPLGRAIGQLTSPVAEAYTRRQDYHRYIYRKGHLLAEGFGVVSDKLTTEMSNVLDGSRKIIEVVIRQVHPPAPPPTPI